MNRIDISDWTEEVDIPLKNGTTITLRRDDEGKMELCSDNACLTLAATASTFLAWIEFFQTLD